MEAKLALTEVALESGDKLAAKDATEHTDGKEEGTARFDPAGTVDGESAGGHHTMDMGVMFELLIPSVGARQRSRFRRPDVWDRERFRQLPLHSDICQQFAHALFLFLARHPGMPAQGEGHILFDGQRIIQGGLLEQESDFHTDLVQLLFVQTIYTKCLESRAY